MCCHMKFCYLNLKRECWLFIKEKKILSKKYLPNGLHAEEIGVVTDTKRIRYYMGGELVGDVPAESLVLGGGAPQYERAYSEPAYYQNLKV